MKKRLLLITILMVMTGVLVSRSVLAGTSYEFSTMVEGIFLSANPYTTYSGDDLEVNFDLYAAGNKVTAEVEIFEMSTGMLVLKDTFEAGDGINIFKWNGKQIGRNEAAPAGDYKVVITGYYPVKVATDSGVLEKAGKVFSVRSMVSMDEIDYNYQVSEIFKEEERNRILEEQAAEKLRQAEQEKVIEEAAKIESEQESNAQEDQSAAGSTAEATAEMTEVVLKEPRDIIKCSIENSKFFIENGRPAYNTAVLNCALSENGVVSAGIYKAEFDAKAEDNSANLIKNILNNKKFIAGGVRAVFDGYDDFDQTIEAGEYVMVAMARPGTAYKWDVSVQKVEVVDLSAETENADGTEGEEGSGSALNQVQSPTSRDLRDEGLGVQDDNEESGTQGENTENTSDQQEGDESALHGSAEESLAGKDSKCQGVKYPTDLPEGRFQAVILMAYDECLVSGYGDGTFRTESGLTRAEAVKIIILAAKMSPKEGCFTSDCGSPFRDLDFWQGKWIRAAWDQRIVSGVAADLFEPNKLISRAQAAALAAKAFKIIPFSGCYDAHCGAGHPNNIFLDVKEKWQGPYLRAMWDKGALLATGKNSFSPDREITRGEFLEMIFKTR